MSLQLTANRAATRVAGTHKGGFKYQFVNTATGRECCATNHLMQLCPECRRAATTVPEVATARAALSVPPRTMPVLRVSAPPPAPETVPDPPSLVDALRAKTAPVAIPAYLTPPPPPDDVPPAARAATASEVIDPPPSLVDALRSRRNP